MSKEHTATFIGHSECYGIDRGRLNHEILHLIENWGGAAKTYARAIQKGLTMINIGEM